MADPAPRPLKTIFVISPIGKLDETGFDYTRLFLDEIVKPAAKLAGGYAVPVRGDEVKAPGNITAKIVTDIVNSDVCVADLTGRNPNVMYEVAIAHAADKQVILLQQEPGGPPFDFTTERSIHYSTRADEANRARDDLAEHLRNAHHDEQDPRLRATMNPVRTIFRDLQTREQATDAQQAILDKLEALGAHIEEIPIRRVPSLGSAESGAFILSPESADLLLNTLGDILGEGHRESLERVVGLLLSAPILDRREAGWVNHLMNMRSKSERAEKDRQAEQVRAHMSLLEKSLLEKSITARMSIDAQSSDDLTVL